MPNCAYTPKHIPHTVIYTDAFFGMVCYGIVYAVCALFRTMILITSANIALVVFLKIHKILSFTLSLSVSFYPSLPCNYSAQDKIAQYIPHPE